MAQGGTLFCLGVVVVNKAVIKFAEIVILCLKEIYL
jgi:hypothetical protein